MESSKAPQFVPVGVYVAMMTPFDEKGEVAEDVVRRIVDFYAANGIDGVFPVSSIGEFARLSHEQQERLAEVVVEQSAGRLRVTVGISDATPAGALKLAEHAAEIGADAVVACPPYYYTLSQDLVQRHFEVIACGTGLPLLLYNIPLFTSQISPAVVESLAHIPEVIGIKDSSGNGIYIMDVLERVKRVRPGFAFLMGREELFLSSLVMGADGCMSGSAGILPELVVGLYRQFQAGDYERARQLQLLQVPLVRVMMGAPFPMGFKAGLEARGFEMGPPKQPFSEAEEHAYAATKARVCELIPRILEEAEAFLPALEARRTAASA